MPSSPKSVVERLQCAMNDQDIQSMVEVFTDNYRSEQPLHPVRSFTGRSEIRKTWGQRFNQLDEFEAEILRHSIDGNRAWVEWYWEGSNSGETTFRAKGVTILDIDVDRISRGRIYME